MSKNNDFPVMVDSGDGKFVVMKFVPPTNLHGESSLEEMWNTGIDFLFWLKQNNYPLTKSVDLLLAGVELNIGGYVRVSMKLELVESLDEDEEVVETSWIKLH